MLLSHIMNLDMEIYIAINAVHTRSKGQYREFVRVTYDEYAGECQIRNR
jgi:hypothetical protein